MMDEYDKYRPIKGCFIALGSSLVLWAVIALILVLMVSCAPKLAPAVVPEVHNNYSGHDSDKSNRERDSIYVHDSIYIYVKGDTVHHYESHWRDRWYAKVDSFVVRDSIHIHDSVPYPVEVVKTVAVRNGYTRFTSWFFWIVLIAFLLLAAWKICDRLPVTSKYTTAIKGFLKIVKFFL